MPDKNISDKPTSRKKAVALHYDQEKNPSPKVIGKGVGLLVDKILELAREHNIPIHEDADLVEVLSKLNVNEEIPESTFVIIAEILAFVYRTNQKYS